MVRPMKFWTKAYQEVKLSGRAVLMYVIHSEGSSPGRQGFKMLVGSDGLLEGSIGGGPMEHKLVELCRSKIDQDFQPFIKRQIHKTNIPENRSGMICSGEQTVAFYQLTSEQVDTIEQLASAEDNGILHLNETGIQWRKNQHVEQRFNLEIASETRWSLEEDLNPPELHIVGGGHVGLALSELGNTIGFKVFIYDNRNGLNTVDQNLHSTFTHVDDYQNIGDYLQNEQAYIVLMSFGYRTDKVILKHLLGRDFRYLGMMGSKEKVKKLYEELTAEGAKAEHLERVYSPIGIPISSKTPHEIAVSIMAQIIQVKNQT